MYDSTKYVRKRVPHLDFHQSCQQMGGPGACPRSRLPSLPSGCGWSRGHSTVWAVRRRGSCQSIGLSFPLSGSVFIQRLWFIGAFWLYSAHLGHMGRLPCVPNGGGSSPSDTHTVASEASPRDSFLFRFFLLICWKQWLLALDKL